MGDDRAGPRSNAAEASARLERLVKQKRRRAAASPSLQKLLLWKEYHHGDENKDRRKARNQRYYQKHREEQILRVLKRIDAKRTRRIADWTTQEESLERQIRHAELPQFGFYKHGEIRPWKRSWKIESRRTQPRTRVVRLRVGNPNQEAKKFEGAVQRSIRVLRGRPVGRTYLDTILAALDVQMKNQRRVQK
jgi:hypothetical protein